MKKYILLLLFFLGVCYSIQSQEFVYRAKNPAFGGESFNYQWMLSSAEAQNTIEDPNQQESNNTTQLEDFTESLNRQFLNRINRALLDAQIPAGEDLAPGTYTFGSLFVEVYDSADGLVVNVLDTDTGDQTQVVIP